MALAKYYEDNRLIADERLRDKEEEIVFINSAPKSNRQKRKADRHDVFCPKKGIIAVVNRGNLITMEFHQHLYDEWLAVLKDNGWKWDYRKKRWYAKGSIANYDFAFEFITGNKELYDEEDDEYLDGYSRTMKIMESNGKRNPE